MEKKRYLTKSRFKLANECPTKLYYTGKAEYANQSLDDSFLLALADGGFQVGELAKYYFPTGYDLTTLNYEQALDETNNLLKLDNVTIFEAAIATKSLLIRTDILVKNGNHLTIYEVKAKSFDALSSSPFKNRNHKIKAAWKPYLEDVAFQKHVIRQALPLYKVSAYLIMADKSSQCPTDGLNQKFRIIKDYYGRKSISVSNSLTKADLTTHILCEVNVDDECDHIYSSRYEKNGQHFSFKEWIHLLANHYVSDTKFCSPISSNCANCEFDATVNDEMTGLRSGKKECWKEQLGWENKDFECPTVLDVWNFRKKSKLMKANRIKMSDITKEDVAPQSDNKPGLSTSERQWLQIEKYQKNDNSAWLDQVNLQREISSWTFPLHFIDFETTMVAIPFNAGRRPYEGIAFQFSHHVIHKDGTVEHFGEYLNTAPGAFPNYNFVRALKAQLENDTGSIFRYSNHENTFLNLIYRQLQTDKSKIEDRAELCNFIKSITKSTKDSVEFWKGPRNMIDMWEIVKRYYYDPATNGSTSIKHVLPAILNSSKYLQKKYSNPLYGSLNGIKSSNFNAWQWVNFQNEKVVNPYKLLPRMFQDISDHDLRILSDADELRDGGAALTAYARMQFEEMGTYERGEIEKALLKYCELDTLAMVMIYEGWKDLLQQTRKPKDVGLFGFKKNTFLDELEEPNARPAMSVNDVTGLTSCKDKRVAVLLAEQTKNNSVLVAIEQTEFLYAGKIDELAEFCTAAKQIITPDAKALFRQHAGWSSIDPNKLLDLGLMAYLLNPEDRDYSWRKLSCKAYELDISRKNGGILALAIAKELEHSLDGDHLRPLMLDIELPLVGLLADMEEAGIRIDRVAFEEFLKEVQADLDNLTRSIYVIAGKPFNIRSSQQLGKVLFEDLGLASKTRTSGRHAPTSQAVLEKLAGQHKIIDLILEYRKLEKLRSTYLEPLPKLADKDCRIHTTFNQLATATGRLSSNNPNLQNIPARGEFGTRMRSCFVAAEGKKLVSADYSQIELRILAHCSQDPTLLDAFKQGKDIHSSTAALLFGKPVEEVTATQRLDAKTINFGLIYGMGPQKLAGELKISLKEAKELIARYFEKLQHLKAFYGKVEEETKELGYMATLANRRRNLPEIYSCNKMLQAQARRQAINTVIQGSAADTIKIAMMKTAEDQQLKQLGAQLILQIHDELVLEVPTKNAEAAARRLQEIMSNVAPDGKNLMDIPLKVDAGIGDRWSTAMQKST